MACNLPASAHGTVIQDYKGGHTYHDPRFPFKDCKIARAHLDGSQHDLLIFSNPVLSIGARIDTDFLQSVRHLGATNFYYLADSAAMINSFNKAANQLAAPRPLPEARKVKSGAEIMDITRRFLA